MVKHFITVFNYSIFPLWQSTLHTGWYIVEEPNKYWRKEEVYVLHSEQGKCTFKCFFCLWESKRRCFHFFLDTTTPTAILAAECGQDLATPYGINTISRLFQISGLVKSWRAISATLQFGEPLISVVFSKSLMVFAKYWLAFPIMKGLFSPFNLGRGGVRVTEKMRIKTPNLFLFLDHEKLKVEMKKKNLGWV